MKIGVIQASSQKEKNHLIFESVTNDKVSIADVVIERVQIKIAEGSQQFFIKF